MAQEKNADGSDVALEFIPSVGGKDCKEFYGGWGKSTTRYEYIWYGNIDEDKYPEDACEPYYHKYAKINYFQIIDNLNGNASITMSNSITGTSIHDTSGNTLSAKKDFDIPHPTKKGHRLRHVCLEGPEAGVYVRGRLTGKNVIELPEYWKGLVDPETITVTLTQIKTSQDLIVDSIEWGSRIKIISGNGTSIDCYYHIQAERNDGEKLIPEYEGTTIEDYPGNNTEYSHNR